jgi:hypothetical protein
MIETLRARLQREADAQSAHRLRRAVRIAGEAMSQAQPLKDQANPC